MSQWFFDSHDKWGVKVTEPFMDFRYVDLSFLAALLARHRNLINNPTTKLRDGAQSSIESIVYTDYHVWDGTHPALSTRAFTRPT